MRFDMGAAAFDLGPQCGATDWPGATVHRFTRDGTSTRLWDRRGAEAPGLVWSAGKRMVGYRHAGDLVTEVLAAPR